MFLNSLNKGMFNIYLNSSYLEKLTFPKCWFSKPRKCTSRSVFDWLQLMQISLNFKICCNLKIWSLWEKPCATFFFLCFAFEIFHFKHNCTVFSCEKTLLNITHDRKGNSTFPHTVLQSFMITIRVRFPCFWKILTTESRICQSSN